MIMGSGKNGAIIHYRAEKDQNEKGDTLKYD
jgi:Xaa-Pro aminopeptidase